MKRRIRFIAGYGGSEFDATVETALMWIALDALVLGHQQGGDYHMGTVLSEPLQLRLHRNLRFVVVDQYVDGEQ